MSLLLFGRAPPGYVPPVTPPPGSGVDFYTSILGVAQASALVYATAAGDSGGELVLSGYSPHMSLRGDQPATITETSGKVSGWSSTISGGWPMTPPGAEAQRGVYDAGGWVSLTSSGEGDANADFFEIGSLSNRYQSNQSDSTGANNRLGILYYLVRIGSVPGYDAYIFRVGANDGSFIYGSRRAYIVGVYGGKLRVSRGDGSATELVDLSTCPTGEWMAMAHVLNDDRTTEGVSDNISRLFVKTKAGGTWATMQTATTAARQVIHHASTRAFCNRGVYQGATSKGSLNMDVGAIYFDPVPPRGASANTVIEANLDKLLARV